MQHNKKMDHLKLTVDKLSVEEINDLVVADNCGAVSLFVGTTRDNFEGKKVLHLEYEAHEAMALKSMKNICKDIRQQWPKVHNIAIYHRLGLVPTREASIVIAISSPHRQDAIEAVSHCIDQLKSSVAIWKKEVYEGEQSVWKENKECPIDDDSEDERPEDIVDKSLIQINVSAEEIQKRIQNFIDRKREQVNISNILDFIPSKRATMNRDCSEIGDEEENETCARIRTVFVKRTGSKGHLKVHKVYNEWGPQTMKPTIKTEPTMSSDNSLPTAIAERVQNIERFVNIQPVSSDIYKRLKEMEDKISHLQSMSPEYAHFWHRNVGNTNANNTKDYLFTADDINRKIEQLEKYGEL